MDLDAYLEPLLLDKHRLERLAIDFSHIYRQLALHSSEQFLATPINVLPKGTEKGQFLAIDVGGSNLRVAFVELLGVNNNAGEIRRMHERSWPIADHFKMDRADQLFEWIGGCIALVVTRYCEQSPVTDASKVIPMGITFSFPMIQSRISEATLMPMGKGFAITSELDLGKMIRDGYSKHIGNNVLPNGVDSERPSTSTKLPEIDIVAITNDTVATLASLAYSAHALPSSRVAMGLIVGTGTNSSIIMKLKDLHEAKRSAIVLPSEAVDSVDTEIVVNTEWTIKGAAPPLEGLVTIWDEELDYNCEAPGFQPFEYMTAGRYLGELCRLILIKYLIQHEQVDTRHLPEPLCHRNGISTLFLSDIVARCESATDLLPKLQSQLQSPDPERWQWTLANADLFLKSAKALRTRSVRMISAATVGLLVSAGELQWRDENLQSGLADAKEPSEELIIAFAGGVITSYPNFLSTCQQTINELVDNLTQTDKVRQVSLRDANFGGLLGAGVLAGTVWNLP